MSEHCDNFILCLSPSSLESIASNKIYILNLFERMQIQGSKSEGGRAMHEEEGEAKKGFLTELVGLHFTGKHNWLLGHVGGFHRGHMETFLRRVL